MLLTSNVSQKPIFSSMRGLNGRQIEAAALVAQDRLSNTKIALKVGISPRTLTEWKQRPDFQAEVSRQAEVIAKAVSESLYSNKQFRMDQLECLGRDLTKIRRERGKSPEMKDIPGGSTGFVTLDVDSYKIMVPVIDPKTKKETGKYRSDVKFLKTHAFDAALFAAHTALYQQIAIETGDWKERREIEHTTPKQALPEWLLQQLKEKAKVVTADSQPAAPEVN